MSSERPITPPQLPLGWLVAMLPRLLLNASDPSPLEVRSWLVNWNSCCSVPGSPAQAGRPARTPPATATTAATATTSATRTAPPLLVPVGTASRPTRAPAVNAFRPLGQATDPRPHLASRPLGLT